MSRAILTGGARDAAEAPAGSHMLDLRTTGRRVEAEPFQREIIDGMARRLRHSDTPILLRAPTGAGKTLMLARALEQTAAETRTLWFWFTPYTHLVSQTLYAIEGTCPRLRPYSLVDERHADHHPGDVLIANVQLVASSNTALRRINVGGDETVSLKDITERATSRGYRIGVVVDEAHLGLSKETVFGGLVREMQPYRLVMATATPRDAKLAAFVNAAGYTQHATFAASRIDAVSAGLNKRYVLAHVYEPRSTVATLADVRATVLLRAWRRHLQVKKALAQAGVSSTPLLLVQVENGPGTVEAAIRALVQTCGVEPALIASHSQETPDPMALHNIANDTSREVLVFKESAGTGFDAPRAFVLASMKHVSDEGFATQFLGRIMRVDRGVRALFKQLDEEGARLPVALDTGYLYLAYPRVQDGFHQAVSTIRGIESELAGALEAIRAVPHRNGSTTFTNIPASQEALVLREPVLPGEQEEEALEDEAAVALAERAEEERAAAVASVRATLVPVESARPVGTPRRIADDLEPPPDDIFGGVAAPAAPAYGDGTLFDALGGLDAVAPPPAPAAPPRRQPPAPATPLADAAAVAEAWARIGVRVYPLRTGLETLGPALRTEVLPDLETLEGVAAEVGNHVHLPDRTIQNAIRSALDGLVYDEKTTELTDSPDAPAELAVGQSPVRGVLNRDRLAWEARRVLGRRLGLGEGDRAVVLRKMAGRIAATVNEMLELRYPDAPPPDETRTRVERDAVHLLVRAGGDELEAAYSEALSRFVRVEDADPLPRALLFPASRALPSSPRNIYGVRPPTQADHAAAEMEDPEVMKLLRQLGSHQHQLADGTQFSAAYMDGHWRLNEFELKLAAALDQAAWVRWWHRNPPLKPYSVGIVKATEHGRFYPDFVVCGVAHRDAEPRQRLLEPKESADDARQRMKRDPVEYGRVFFLKRRGDRIFVRKQDGRLGKEVGDDLEGLRELLERGE
jgi:hypothetical protein